MYYSLQNIKVYTFFLAYIITSSLSKSVKYPIKNNGKISSFVFDYQSNLATVEWVCNRFQTHKRFKRFEVYKSDVLVLLFWKQNMTLSQSDRFPPWGENNLIGQSDYFPSWRENDLIGSSLSHD